MVWAGSAEAAPAHHPCRWGARRGLANDLTGSHECADLKASCFLGSRPTYPSLVLAHAAPPPHLAFATRCSVGQERCALTSLQGSPVHPALATRVLSVTAFHSA